MHAYGIYTVVCDYICRSRRPCGLRRGSAADRLLGLGVWTRRGDACLCLFYNKDKRQSQDNQDKAVQIKYRDRTKKRFRWWHRISCGLFVVFCVGSGLYDKMIICWEESYRVLIENTDLGRILGFKAEKQQMDDTNYLMREVIVCGIYQILLRNRITKYLWRGLVVFYFTVNTIFVRVTIKNKVSLIWYLSIYVVKDAEWLSPSEVLS